MKTCGYLPFSGWLISHCKMVYKQNKHRLINREQADSCQEEWVGGQGWGKGLGGGGIEKKRKKKLMDADNSVVVWVGGGRRGYREGKWGWTET